MKCNYVPPDHYQIIQSEKDEATVRCLPNICECAVRQTPDIKKKVICLHLNKPVVQIQVKAFKYSS